MKRVYFVRHGETEGNLGRFFQSSDTPLSDGGHEGGKAVADRCVTLEIDHVIASHYKRAQQTAEYISERISVPVETKEFLHEIDRPTALRGKSHDSEEGRAHRKSHAVDYWREDWSEEGAENFYDVIKRVAESIQYIEDCQHENVLVVAHGDFIGSVVAYLLVDKSEAVDLNKAVFTHLERMSNVAITEFTYKDGAWKLFLYNDHAHFAE